MNKTHLEIEEVAKSLDNSCAKDQLLLAHLEHMELGYGGLSVEGEEEDV